MDWLRGNPHFTIGHKAITYLEYSGILKLEFFLLVAEKFLSGIGRITHSLGKTVKEKEGRNPISVMYRNGGSSPISLFFNA